ncbi:YihY/virulence factor BrkB family protein [Paenisporosarcina antarctica]|uniref:YihY/virulence factor BrkB family protein n=1 Tax=Paenisporosarcina antarctica TaxID=417367 RepID=A0A4P7A1W1_9BACL|nr:YihY/virulence factor BrkB family protein [Paenisporosarcina antarctica]QBP43030.1 YihY/virulence factor BrkB family protein [Paenisporosarcina antarctica]
MANENQPIQPKGSKQSRSSYNFLNKIKLMQFKKKDKGPDEPFDVTSSKGFFQELLARIKYLDVTALGAQLAFFFLLSLFPLLIFMVTLLPYLNLQEDQLFSILRTYAPDEVYKLIYGTVNEVLTNRNGGLLSVGILATIWTASNGMNALIKSLNRSYSLEETRPFIIARSISVIFTLLLITLFVIALVLPVFGEQIGIFLFSYLGYEQSFLTVWNSIRWTIPPVMIFVVFMLLYWIAPNRKLYLKSVIPGAIFATLGWILVSLAFSFYVSSFANYSATYGSIGGIIVLMMWLYFSGTILMVGGQINAVMQERKEKLDMKKAGAVV